MANLRLKNVVKSFGNNVVVRDFNLEVKDENSWSSWAPPVAASQRPYG